ncbi:hypothetical protein BGX29_002355 [Mortierella sp. GBA35]|nr:hypothetical protein BGX29_002355 [Mortierella sp. GBA35]
MSSMEADVMDRSDITSSILTEKFRAIAKSSSLRMSGGQVKSVRKSKTNKQREEDYQRENIEDGDSAGTGQESESPVSDDDYTHGAKRQPKSLQTSKVAKQRKYDFQPKDDQDSELSEDSLRDRASSRSDELVVRPKAVSRRKEKPQFEVDDVEDDDAGDTEHSLTDLYELDDLSHLTQLGTQREEVQSESQESDREVDKADMARDLSVKKLKIVKYRPFDVHSKISFQRRFESLGSKWVLSASTVVEDKLYEIGMASEFYGTALRILLATGSLGRYV